MASACGVTASARAEVGPDEHLRVLAVGDPYMPASTFAAAFSGLGLEHRFEYLDVEARPDADPRTPSERRIREYIGTPDQLLPQMGECDVLVVHGAPVTEE